MKTPEPSTEPADHEAPKEAPVEEPEKVEKTGQAEDVQEEEKSPSCSDNIRTRWADAQAAAFSKLGGLMAREPYGFIVVPWLLFIAFGFGVYNSSVETDPAELWVQTGSRLEEEVDFYEDAFDGFSRAFVIQGSPKKEYEGANMMEKRFLDEAYLIDGQIADMRTVNNIRWYALGRCGEVHANTTQEEARNACESRDYALCGWDTTTNRCMFQDGFGLLPTSEQRGGVTYNYLGREWGMREFCDETRVPISPGNNIQRSELEDARAPCSKQFTPQDCFLEHAYSQQTKSLKLLGWVRRHPYSSSVPDDVKKAFARPCHMWQGSFNAKGYTLGGLEIDEAVQEATKVSAFKWVYIMHEKNGFARKYNDYVMNHRRSGIFFRQLGYPERITVDQAEDILDGWEEKMADHLEEWRHQLQYTDIAWLSSWVIDDVIDRAGTDNQPYIIIGLVLLLVVVWLFLFSVNIVSSRLLLGFGGVLGIALALFATFGFSALCGIQYNFATMQVMPYVVMGLGIDDMFVMLHYFPEDATEDIELRMKKCYGHAGPSILATSLINSVVFFVGSSTPVVAIRSFALQSGIAVIFNFLIILLSFGGMLVLDARRIQSRGMDCLPCITTETEPKAPSNRVSKTVAEVVLRPIVTMLPLQILFMVLTFILLGFSIWGAASLDLGLPLKEFVKSGGQVARYLDVRTEYFRTEPNRIVGRPGDWHTRENQIKLNRLVYQQVLNPDSAFGIKGELKFASKYFLPSGPAWFSIFRQFALQYPGGQDPANDCTCYPRNINDPIFGATGRHLFLDHAAIAQVFPHECTINPDMYYDLLKLFMGEKTCLEGVNTSAVTRVNPHDPSYYPSCVYNPLTRQYASTGPSTTYQQAVKPTCTQVELSLGAPTPTNTQVVYQKGLLAGPLRPFADPGKVTRVVEPATCAGQQIDVSSFEVTLSSYIPGDDFIDCTFPPSAAFEQICAQNLNLTRNLLTGSFTLRLTDGSSLSDTLWDQDGTSPLALLSFITGSDLNRNIVLTARATGGGCTVTKTVELIGNNKVFLDPTGGEYGWASMSSYALQVKFSKTRETNPIDAWTISLINNPVEQSDVDLELDMMKETRDLMDASGLPLYATGGSYIFAEQYLYTRENTRNLIIICLCASFVLMSIMMASITLALIQTLVISCSMVVILGGLVALDLQLNAISILSVAFGVGLNVELEVHICRCFLVTKPAFIEHSPAEQRKDRIVVALSEMAVPVFDGAFTSFIGVLVLAFSSVSFFDSYFFQFYSLMILIALWHSFIPLPILLCWFGPDWLPSHVVGDAEAEEIRSRIAHEEASRMEEVAEEHSPDHAP